MPVKQPTMQSSDEAMKNARNKAVKPKSQLDVAADAAQLVNESNIARGEKPMNSEELRQEQLRQWRISQGINIED